MKENICSAAQKFVIDQVKCLTMLLLPSYLSRLSIWPPDYLMLFYLIAFTFSQTLKLSYPALICKSACSSL